MKRALMIDKESFIVSEAGKTRLGRLEGKITTNE